MSSLIRSCCLLGACCSALPALAQEHEQHDMASMSQNSAMASGSVISPGMASLQQHMHGSALNYFISAERLEWLPDADAQQWEGQGWYGSDRHKLWIKTEGLYDTREDELDTGELQFLYSHALAPFWDLQSGLRFDSGQGESRTFATVGLMGLAPYWFELDLAAFVSDQGTLSARLDAEYELRFTQRLILQPRLELNYSAADDLAAGIGQGMNEVSAGLRLRYEWRREFAPYLGLEWGRAYGATADLLRRQGLDISERSWVAGLRFWY